MDEFTRGELEGMRDAWLSQGKAELETWSATGGSSGRSNTIFYGGGGAGQPAQSGAVGYGGRNTVGSNAGGSPAGGGGGGATQPPGYWLGYGQALIRCAEAITAMLADGGHDA